MRQSLVASIVVVGVSLFGCGTGTYSLLDQSANPDGGARLSNDEVFRGLTPSCQGCHSAEASIPSFSSLAAFENLIVYNPSMVTVGSPDASELVRLLERTSGTGRTMPPNIGFADLASRGQTRITVAQVRRWISQLQPRSGGGTTAARDAVTLRRKTAEQAVETLKDQLGLTDGDFLAPAGGTPNEPYFRTLDVENYPVRSPDSTGIITDYYGQTVAKQLFLSLGAPNLLNNRKRTKVLGPIFLQIWIPLSQAWCRTAVEKPNNSEFFREASLGDSSDSTAGIQRIRNNIAYLHLRMLGESATDVDVDDLLNGIFLHYLPPGSSPADRNKVPWIAVCAALAQDPLWLTY
jgi:hypothetical protein